MAIIIKKQKETVNVKGTLLAVLVLGLCISITSASIRSLKELRRTQNLIKERAMLLDEVKRENEELKKQMDLEASKEFIEKEIRNKLDYSKEGETVLILPPDEELRKYAPNEAFDEEAEIPNWKKWAWIFDIPV